MDDCEFFCFDCNWEGSGGELQFKIKNAQNKEFIYCPNCGSSSIEECDYYDNFSGASILSLN